MKNVHAILTQNKKTDMSSCDFFFWVEFHIIDHSQIFDFFLFFASFNDFLGAIPLWVSAATF